jgi:hypothetical protein
MKRLLHNPKSIFLSIELCEYPSFWFFVALSPSKKEAKNQLKKATFVFV